MNSALTRQVIEVLLEGGVREFCLCAGARNAPFVSQLANVEGIKLYQFFEERSAAFFALGRTRETDRPVAVVMTSGTAVAECLPAVIEGFYQGLPLVILSADRPRAYRGTGAPQSIDQPGIFSSYAETCIDLASPAESFDLSMWSRRRPLHVNVCFEEPDAREVFPALKSAAAEPVKKSPFFRMTQAPTLRAPVAIVGPLTDEERPRVQEFLERTPIPFVAEGPSALQVPNDVWKRRIRVPEKTLARGFQDGIFQSVLRLGGVPTHRFWRDLEAKFSKVPVVSCSNLDFTGLSRPVQHFVGVDNLLALRCESAPFSSLIEKDRECFERLLILLEKYPRAEANFVREFALRAHRDWVYLGNSLPIREWDLVSGDLPATKVWANRGANGIDGQTSSFLGWTQATGPAAWALIGDLTAMYDLTAPWVTPQLEERERRIVIINNFGGHIFKPMFQKEIFLNRHEIRFGKWAEMWNWPYVSSDSPELFREPLAGSRIVEVCPDEKSTELFNQEWRAM